MCCHLGTGEYLAGCLGAVGLRRSIRAPSCIDITPRGERPPPVRRLRAAVADGPTDHDREAGSDLSACTVKQRVAEVLIAEIGVEMTAFPTPKHLASWAKVCPGNDQSAGKRRSGKTGKGNKWLRGTLTEAALAATTTKASTRSAFRTRRACFARCPRASSSLSSCCSWGARSGCCSSARGRERRHVRRRRLRAARAAGLHPVAAAALRTRRRRAPDRLGQPHRGPWPRRRRRPRCARAPAEPVTPGGQAARSEAGGAARS